MVPLQFGKVLEVVVIVLVPVALGMRVHRRMPAFSARMEKPMKIFSAVVLGSFALLAIAKDGRRCRHRLPTSGQPCCCSTP